MNFPFTTNDTPNLLSELEERARQRGGFYTESREHPDGSAVTVIVSCYPRQTRLALQTQLGLVQMQQPSDAEGKVVQSALIKILQTLIGVPDGR